MNILDNLTLDQLKKIVTDNPHFADPAAEFTRGIEKRLLHYEREDGVAA